MADEKVYSPAQLAEKVGISRAVVYQLIARGELTVIRRGNGSRARVWIEMAAWDAYKAARRQPARIGEQIVSAPRPRSDVRDLPGASRYVS